MVLGFVAAYVESTLSSTDDLDQNAGLDGEDDVSPKP